MAVYTNAKQVIPALFKQIMENHNAITSLKALPVIPFDCMKLLLSIKRENVRAAEHVLRWNTDKGNTA